SLCSPSSRHDSDPPQAQSYANEFDLHKSLRCYNQAIQLWEKQITPDSDHSKFIELLQASSYTLLELGQNEKAQKRLLRILSLTDEPPHETLMYLAQLNEGKESLAYYRRGLDAIHRESNKVISPSTSSVSTNSCQIESLCRAESNAWCAIAELYMTDLCDEPEARTECERAFEGAIQVDPTNPQGYLTAANYYTVINAEQQARDSIHHCLNLWWSKLENFLNDYSARRSGRETELASSVEVGATGDSTVNDKKECGNSKEEIDNKDEDIQLDMEELTGISSAGLLTLVRLMIQWEMWEKSETLLDALLEEDEDNVEIHYLLTEVGRHLWKEEDPQLLRYHALQTKIVSTYFLSCLSIMATKLGDQDLADDMAKLLLELPEDEESGSREAESISSTSSENEHDPD
ncbi:hypothetical protein FBUS_03380, partial [Fasciolopsis buskii]